MSRLTQIGDWFEQRLKIGPAIRETATHRVPTKSASWFYVFGSAALTVFMLQIFTGIMLALIYVPSAQGAWDSLQYSESRRHPRMVSARRAWLGIELHGRHRAYSHGAGRTVRRL